MNDAIAFKTRMTGLTTVPIDINKLDQLDIALSNKMRNAPKAFFKAAPFIADLNETSSLTITELQFIKSTFTKHDLLLIGLTNHQLNPDLLAEAGLANIPNQQQVHPSDTSKAATPQTQRLDTSFNPHSPTKQQATQNTSHNNTHNVEANDTSSVLDNLSAKTRVVKRHIRSGQRLYAPEGDLVVIGIVGAGAEVIADGNIFILGSLRGRAFAGAKGNVDAFIYTQELNAELISIAGNYQTMEQLEVYKNSKNVLMTLTEDETMQIKAL